MRCDGGSRRIAVSVLEEALGLAREQDDSQVTSSLMGQFGEFR